MYGIKFIHEDDPQTVQYGLVRAQRFTNLAEAFERVSDNLLEYPDVEATLPIGEVDPAWGDLSLGPDTLVSLSIEPHGDGYLLIIDDAYTGSDTSVGVDSLADVFDFMVRWTGTMVESLSA